MNADQDPNLMIPRSAYRALRAIADGYREALARIAAGPNDAPHSEPWSRAEALVALSREQKP